MASPARLPRTRRSATLILICAALVGGGFPTAAMAAPGAPTDTTAWLARVVYRTVARRAPQASAKAATTVLAVSQWGGPQQLLVLGYQRDADGSEWVKVRLDVRPNRNAVWLNANDAVLSQTHWRIVVSRAQRRLHVYLDGRQDRTWQVVVGKPSTPTPAGLFAIAGELRQPDPNAFVGSWVLPLTAHSNVLMHFEGGDGQVALHGRGGASLVDPVGTALSHGCVRMDNDMIAWLANHVPIGTPVQIG